jgi:hypothetical protein
MSKTTSAFAEMDRLAAIDRKSNSKLSHAKSIVDVSRRRPDLAQAHRLQLLRGEVMETTPKPAAPKVATELAPNRKAMIDACVKRAGELEREGMSHREAVLQAHREAKEGRLPDPAEELQERMFNVLAEVFATTR